MKRVNVEPEARNETVLGVGEVMSPDITVNPPADQHGADTRIGFDRIHITRI